MIGLRPLFKELGLDPASGNLEEIYDSIVSDPSRAEVRERLERAIWDYFAAMEIPNHVTPGGSLVKVPAPGLAGDTEPTCTSAGLEGSLNATATDCELLASTVRTVQVVW